MLTPQVRAPHFLKFTHLAWTFERSHPLKRCPDGKGLATNTIKHSLVIKHFDVVLSDLTISNMFERTKCFLQFLIKCLMSFKFYQTPSKKGVQPKKDLVTKQCLREKLHVVVNLLYYYLF